ncbi:MAG: L-threonylcarbamoyladenylate synthase [Bauldia sp.]
MGDARERRIGIEAAIAVLGSGGLVAMPTETVYGLAADATLPRAIAGIFAAKGRPRFNPLIVHVPTIGRAQDLAEFDDTALRLAVAFWPGPLTLVLPQRRGNGIADLATAGLPTIAIRVPAHPVARELLTAYDRPLAAPSANRSGHVSPTTAAHVAADLGDALAVILDAGPTAVGVESTIVGFEHGAAVLLRPGGVGRAAIEEVLGVRVGEPANDGRVAAPGMLASHYAPSVPLRLDAASVGTDESLIAFGALPDWATAATAIRNLSETGDLAEAATRLFSALRDLEALGRPIAAMPVPHVGLGEAINDRLRRAAAPRG